MAYELKPFAGNLRTALEAAEMTQEGLAREVGVTLAAVSLWCRGKSEPTGASLIKLAAALDRQPAWFFSSSDTEREAA